MENKNCWLSDYCNKSDNCPEFCIKNFKLKSLYDQALFSEKQRKRKNLHYDADLTDRNEFLYLKDIQNHINEFVETGQNLYLHSRITGNGKTAWCEKLIQTYLEKNWYRFDLSCKALYINIPKYLMELKNSFSERSDYIDHIKKHVMDADIVLWDELGTKPATDFEKDTLLSIINSRLDSGKSNLYTSNINLQELRVLWGDRLYSRISRLSVILELNGKDKRGLL